MAAPKKKTTAKPVASKKTTTKKPASKTTKNPVVSTTPSAPAPTAQSILVGQTVFVYQDGDHGDVEVFATLDAAKAYAEKHWPYDPVGEEDEEYTKAPLWDEESGTYHFKRTDYVTIETKAVK